MYQRCGKPGLNSLLSLRRVFCLSDKKLLLGILLGLGSYHSTVEIVLFCVGYLRFIRQDRVSADETLVVRAFNLKREDLPSGSCSKTILCILH